jgi:type II secretory pathway pseudopilin PulG
VHAPLRELPAVFSGSGSSVQGSRQCGARGRNRGITLIEVAAVLMIAGLLLQAVVSGQSLIHTARVRNVIAQQDAAAAAVLGFRDRYRALPGDYAEASVTLVCAPDPCPHGDGNGLVEPGNGAGAREDIFAWTHLSAAGFLADAYRSTQTVVQPDALNTPVNVYGAYLHLASDARYGYSGNASSRLNVKTGNLTPVSVLAEIDRKVDDCLAASGSFQFSSYAGSGPALPPGGVAGACTDADTPQAQWNTAADAADCGAATVLH